MRRMNNLITLFTAIFAFFCGTMLTSLLINVDKCLITKNGAYRLQSHADIFLMILILSAPHYTEKRHVIRKTWLQLGQPLELPYYPEDFIYLPRYNTKGHLEMESVFDQANRLHIYLDWLDSLKNLNTNTIRNINIKHYFAIGTGDINPNLHKELSRENHEYEDLLLLPKLIDSYENLTNKLIQSVETLTYLMNFSYLLKVDDDTYVKLNYLLNDLVSYDRKLTRKYKQYDDHLLPALYWGYFNGRANVKTKGQWAETNYYLSQHYITYALGGGYILNRQICELIANHSRQLSTYVSEDISVGTWLAGFRHIYRRHDTRFDTGFKPRKCRQEHIVLHKRNITAMQNLFRNKHCKPEATYEHLQQTPKEYYYDWHKTADNCCDYFRN